MANFFDRFDPAPNADLTQPQGGMDQMQTPAALHAAAAAAVAPPKPTPNYFDRFDPKPGATPAPAPSSTGDFIYGQLGWDPHKGVIDNALGTDQWRNLLDRIGLATGAIDPSTYRGNGAPQKPGLSAYHESNLDRMGDVANDAIQYTPGAAAARSVAQLLPATEDFVGTPGADNSVAAQQARAHDRVAMTERERRDAYARTALDDPFNRDPGLTPGNIERFGADALGMVAGSTLGDPTNAIAPGDTLLAKIGGQAGIGAGMDLATQLVERQQGVRDGIDPVQTAITAAGGALIPAVIEGVPAFRAWWRSRGVNVDHVPDENLVASSLDGSIGGPDAAAEFKSFMDYQNANRGQNPLTDAAMARQAAELEAARTADIAANRPAPMNTDVPVAGIGSKRLDKIIGSISDQRAQPDHVEPSRTIPNETVIIAAPEGNVRSDDHGGLQGLERNRAFQGAAMDEAEKRLREDPTMAAILDSTASHEQKLAAVLKRMEENRTKEFGPGDMPDLKPIPKAISEPTPEAAAAAVRRGANPRQSLIHDITVSSESGGNPNAVSPKGAKGTMQVMDATNRDPGYGVRPAANDSPEERARVGRDYIDALRDHYGGDMRKAWAAYNAGPGAVEGATRKYGADWFDHMPEETRKYTNKNLAMLGGERVDTPYRAGDFSRSSGERGYSFDPTDSNAGLRRNTTDTMGEFENTSKPTSPAGFEYDRGGQSGPDMATGESSRPFKSGPENADYEDAARAKGEEFYKKAQADLEAEWERRSQEQAQREANRGADERFRRERTQGEQASRGDPSGVNGGKYDQRPHKDGDFWRVTPEGFIGGKDGNPVAFRNAKEAAKWAAANEMGGDFELVSFGSQNRAGTQRISLRKREGSTYGMDSAEGGAGGAAGASAGGSPGREFAGAADYDRSATIDSRGKALGSPESVGERPPVSSATDAPNPSERPAGGEIGGNREAGDTRPVGEPAGGAPEPGAARPSREPLTGGTEQVVTARGRPVDTQFEVHEARDLIGSDSPQYDQRFQPRDRANRAASDAQVSEIASRLDPEQLHSSRLASQGAPVVGPDRMVESGNGRVAAIKRAYELHPEKAAEYRRMIERRGHDTSGFEQPVLVRKRTTPMDDHARGDFVREANERDTMGMSSTEQAKVDAKSMSSETVGMYRGGSVADAGNRDFAKRWIDEVASPGERNQLIQPDGSLSADGVRRMRSSLLAKAFDDADLVAKVVEDPDTEIRAIGNVLTDTAPGFAKLRERVAEGDLPAEYDITHQVAEAANMIARARSEGKRVGDLVRQDDMFGGRTDSVTEAVTRLMFKDPELTKPRSAADIGEGLRHYLSDVAKHSDTDMFGDGASPARAVQVLDAARERLDAKRGSPAATMFRRAKRDGFAGTGATWAKKPLGGELDRLASEAPKLGQRELAKALEPLVGDIEVRYGDVGGSSLFERKKGSVEMWDDDGPMAVSVHSQGDAETILHEAVHTATMARYGVLIDATNESVAGKAAEGPIRDLMRLWQRAQKSWRPQFDVNGVIKSALEDPDEFLAYGLTNPTVQKWLQRNSTANLWGRFVDGVRGILGLAPKYGNMLDEVLRTGSELLEKAKGDAPIGDRLTNRKAPGDDPLARRFSKETAQPDEKGWNRIADIEGLKGDFASIKRAVGNPVEAAKSFLEPMKRVVSAGVFTNDARLRGLAAKFKSDSIRELADMFNSRAGAGDGTGRTYHEAVHRAQTTRTQQAFETLQPHLGNEAAMGRIRDMLATPNKVVRATPEERAAAGQIRDLLKDTLEYRKDAGESIGEVTDGYFPRLLDPEKVAKGQDKFIAAAEKLYRGVGADDPAKAARDWFGHIFDTYAGLDGGLGFGRMSGDGIGARTSKARQFGKDADNLLRDFYQHDVMGTLATYFSGSARKAEYTRRFGVKGREGSAERADWERANGNGTTQLDVLERRIKRDVHDSGVDPQGVLRQIESVMASNLGRMGTTDQWARTSVSYLHAWNQLAKMDRVTVSSLGDLTMGFIRGGPKYGFSFLKDHFQETARHIRGAPPSEAARWAEAIGVANDAYVNQVLLARSGIEGGTATTQKVLTNYYKAVGIQQFTEGGRVAAAKMAQRMLYDFSHDLTSSNARIRSRASLYLKELGIQNPEAFAEQLRKGAPTREDVLADKGFAAEYSTAAYRAVQQTILMPSRAEKPTWSAHPVGSLLFSLMGYSYGFKKNVLDRAGRLAALGVKERDAHLLIPAFSLSIMAAFQALNDTYIRPAIYGSSYDFSTESPTEAMMRIADRAGFLGALSPVVNAIKAVRYDRSLSESLSGPVIGSLFNAAQKGIIEPLSDRNSPNTDTAERNAAAALYDAVLEPAVDAIAAARLKGIARSAVILGTGNKRGGVLPGDKSAFVDEVGGPDPKADQ